MVKGWLVDGTSSRDIPAPSLECGELKLEYSDRFICRDVTVPNGISVFFVNGACRSAWPVSLFSAIKGTEIPLFSALRAG
jgi:hypothetical protein